MYNGTSKQGGKIHQLSLMLKAQTNPILVPDLNFFLTKNKGILIIKVPQNSYHQIAPPPRKTTGTGSKMLIL